MKIAFHRHTRGNSDPELKLAITLTGLFGVVVMAGLFLPGTAVPLCIFHRLTGIPCMTCGMVRSLHLLIGQEWSTAFRMQPLFVTILAGITILTVYSWIVALLCLPRLRLANISRGTKYFMAWAFVALILLNWIYLIRSGI